MCVLYAIRSTLSAIRDKSIILHHKSQCFKHLGVLMAKNPFHQRNPRLLNYLLALMSLWLKNPFNLRNLRLINDLRLFKPLYNCRETFTDVMSALQIRLFMQNKANFRRSQMNVNKVLTKNYEQMDTWSIGKNKANTNPIQSQYKPNQTQNKPNTNPIKPNFSAHPC